MEPASALKCLQCAEVLAMRSSVCNALKWDVGVVPALWDGKSVTCGYGQLWWLHWLENGEAVCILLGGVVRIHLG